MNNAKLYAIFFIAFIFNTAYGQQSVFISAPTGLKEVGMNKVLCMKNGNTMLFHFEPRKPLIVKVYDTLHKEIATQKHLCNALDINVFETSIFKGLYDINGEAVLFVEQSHNNKRVLVRVRFNAVTGDIINENVPVESPGAIKPTSFFVMKDKATDGYSILCSTDVSQFKECNLYVEFYNSKHESQKKVSIDFDRKAYDYMHIVGAESQPNGNCITIALDKLVTNETAHSAEVSNTRAVYDHFIMMAYIPENTTVVREKIVNLSTETFPYYANYTYNPFAQTLNLLVFSYKEFLQKNGLDLQPTALKSALLLNLDEENMSLKYNWIKNQMANVYYQQQTDTTKLYDGNPIKMFTNENGLCTIVSEAYNQYNDIETKARSSIFDSYFGKIGITQCDDEGKELWGIVLPGAQYLKSYRHYYYAHELSDRWQDQAMFDDMPPQVYNRQFVSLNTYTYNKNYYIIYNDYNKNFNNSITHPGDTVYTFDNTNACVYKLNKKKEVTKSYLFGEPAANEYKAAFIEGADFDERKGMYATLVQYHKDNDVDLCMAWCQLN